MERSDVYCQAAEFFAKFGLIGNGQKGIKKLGRDLQKWGIVLTIIASDDVVEKYLHWRSLSMDGSSDAQVIVTAYANMIFAMRQDVTINPNTNCTVETILDAMA